jgi:hypothetical protein
MSLKVITSLLVLLLVLAACRLTEDSEVQPSGTPPPRATKVAPLVKKIPPTGTPTVASSNISTSTDFTSVPALSDSQIEQLVFDELEPCKIARGEQLENEVPLPTRSNMRAATFG